MSTNLLIIVAIAVVLAAQAATILVVRHLVRKWCLDVYKSGFRGGKQAGSEPFAEAYKIGYDIGHERGSQDALTDRAMAELSLEELERLTTRLFKATAARYDALNAGTEREPKP